LILDFLSFYLKAKTVYKVPSPFLYHFFTEVLDDDRDFYVFSDLQLLRQRLSKDKRRLLIEDLGAGSRKTKTKNPKLKDILANAVSPQWQLEWLFKICETYQPKYILELGSSLGLSTIALGSANQSAKLISIEGSEALHEIAQLNINEFGLKNCELRCGSFDQVLPEALSALGRVDLAFLDGNHKKTPTVQYFEQILPYCHDQTILILDDIYWSEEMKEAWKLLQSRSEVSLSIDLFYFGLLFFSPDFKEKMHEQLIPKKWKPFQWGFFP